MRMEGSSLNLWSRDLKRPGARGLRRPRPGLRVKPVRESKLHHEAGLLADRPNDRLDLVPARGRVPLPLRSRAVRALLGLRLRPSVARRPLRLADAGELPPQRVGRLPAELPGLLGLPHDPPPVDGLVPNRSQRRCLKRNEDVTVTLEPARALGRETRALRAVSRGPPHLGVAGRRRHGWIARGVRELSLHVLRHH
jgi:hypothetical protein